MAYPKHAVAPSVIITGAGQFDGDQLRQEAFNKNGMEDPRVRLAFATAASVETYKNNGFEKI